MDLTKSFHPFDIRGDYPAAVNEHMAYLVGKFVQSFLPQGAIVVAADNRESSPFLVNALVNGLAVGHREVVFIGNVPTPVFYFAVNFLKAAGGVMVTASHVAGQQNGFKFTKAGALPLDEGEILTLKNFLESQPADDQRNKSLYKISVEEAVSNRSKVVSEYITQMVSKFSGLKFPGLVIFDTGETVATPIVEEILSRLTISYELLKQRRGLNPLLDEVNLNLREKVKERQATLGIIYDGDADRVVFIDRQGNLIPPSYILGLVAKHFTKVALDIRSGLAAYTTDHVVTPSWAQNLKFAMSDDTKIAFAGETSGHLIFREWYGIDDGIFAGFKFLELVTNLDSELSELRAFYTDVPEINFEVTGDSTLVLDKIADYYRMKEYPISIIDGVTITSSDFHLNLRMSLTEPFLRLNLEVKRPEQVEAITEEIKKLIYAEK
ncbi:hypothetical protein A2872_02970 [Candidatus Gottesmanbacteria bacterium RIFCSPHIGHO2_01_FULL_42_12]|uniref:Phosphomannomutase n=1 Tax=Candidatus Gottesmanbacteria bacterium RIFCSPHIGHO2_01_FULL_42_12 TaxID=1798377 RepID=A0A1F5Z4W7_9BACT|nr:MAG: hypothetical protein A2872_02970 [Candidatus Gottesmanbacteria bacterium RIFCSPHIGHO2_01_FULL_42_12]